MKGKIAFTKLFRNHGGGIKRGVEKKWAEHFNQNFGAPQNMW